jgi:Flp pilus assembly pilin Flp
MLRKLFRNRKGQGLVEYGLIIAGVALICAVGISVFGHKTSDMISAVAAVLPGAHTDDNNAIESGKLIETTMGTAGISLDTITISANSNKDRLGQNVLGTAAGAANGFNGLVVENTSN